MCGINIIISTIDIQIKEPLQLMQEANNYRGPDASDLIVYTNINWQIGVGVNRLQVVDTDERSNQPMVSKCGNYVLAYNGEVYNYQDLKNQLISKGYMFSTHSDTEVVMLWLQEYGYEGLKSLKGMFALAFVNLTEKKVITARDRHGIKPLFYYKTAATLVLSSTIQAIEASKLANLSINDTAISDYLSYRHVMGNYTFYDEIQSYAPGTVLVYDEKLSVEHSVIKPQSIEEDRNLKNILTDTVSLLFEAQKPPGLMLSGGVDSTLLLAILHEELGISGINTYTLGSGDDGKWAKKAANQYGSNHHEISVTPESLFAIDDFLELTDQPVADHGAFATWLVAREAAKNSNILLSGAGADELFAGYNRHWAYYYYIKNQRQAIFLQRAINKSGLKGLLPKPIKQLLNSVDINPICTYRNFLQSHGIKQKKDIDIYWQDQMSLMDNLREALEFDRQHYLVADVLAITDNATMQNGVEARTPYLYDDVLTYASTISLEEKIKNKGKAPLKEILAEYNGIKYTTRKKQGFGLPLADWLRNKRSFWLWEFLISDSPIFAYVSKLKIYELLRLHQQGKMDNSMQLWSILVLEKWLSRFYK